jgi:hypothetical protein
MRLLMGGVEKDLTPSQGERARTHALLHERLEHRGREPRHDASKDYTNDMRASTTASS